MTLHVTRLSALTGIIGTARKGPGSPSLRRFCLRLVPGSRHNPASSMLAAAPAGTQSGWRGRVTMSPSPTSRIPGSSLPDRRRRRPVSRWRRSAWISTPTRCRRGRGMCSSTFTSSIASCSPVFLDVLRPGGLPRLLPGHQEEPRAPRSPTTKLPDRCGGGLGATRRMGAGSRPRRLVRGRPARVRGTCPEAGVDTDAQICRGGPDGVVGTPRVWGSS